MPKLKPSARRTDRANRRPNLDDGRARRTDRVRTLATPSHGQRPKRTHSDARSDGAACPTELRPAQTSCAKCQAGPMAGAPLQPPRSFATYVRRQLHQLPPDRHVAVRQRHGRSSYLSVAARRGHGHGFWVRNCRPVMEKLGVFFFFSRGAVRTTYVDVMRRSARHVCVDG